MQKKEFGARLTALRRELGMTQEQLAYKIGITGPAVSKWEQGHSYPDIELIAPLARALKTNPDTLLAFEETLREEKVAAMERALNEVFEREGFAVGYTAAEAAIKEYSNSNLLKFRLAGVYMRYLILMRNDGEAQAPIRRMLELNLEVAQSGDPMLTLPATLVASQIHMMLEEYDEAERLIESLPKTEVRRETVYPSLYMAKGEHEKAEKSYQQNLYQAVSDAVLSLSGLISNAKRMGKNERALLYSDAYAALVDLFAFPDINARLMRLLCLKELGRADEALLAAEEYVDRFLNRVWESDFSIKLCFDRLEGIKKGVSPAVFQKAAYEALGNMINPEDDPRLRAVIERMKGEQETR